jgi:hypothetical protein
MSFFDRSPGGGLAAANAILYATVLIETWMLTTGSLFVMGLVMAMVIVLAALLCRYVMHLMGTEEYVLGEEPVTVVAPAPVAAAVTTPTTATSAPAPAAAAVVPAAV